MGYSVAHKFVGLSPQQLEKNTGHNPTRFLFEYLHLTRAWYEVCLQFLRNASSQKRRDKLFTEFWVGEFGGWDGIELRQLPDWIRLARGLRLAGDGNTNPSARDSETPSERP